MPLLARRTRVIFALVAFAAALAAWQGAAAGALQVTDATLNPRSDGGTGATSVSSPPGGVFEAEVTAKVGLLDEWGGTQYRFDSGSRQCVNTDNEGSGTHSNTFDLTAPGDPGAYDMDFWARERGNPCEGDESAQFPRPKMLNVTDPGENPNLPARCGINVMLILDESGSIKSPVDYTKDVRSAAKAFVNALSGTGSKVAIVDFSTEAQLEVPYKTVNADTIKNNFNPYIDNKVPGGYDPGGWTNWQDAFFVANQTNATGPVADMVVFITDGDPTARNDNAGKPVDNLVNGEAEALTLAAREADKVKAKGLKVRGSHVFTIGVGAAVTQPLSARRLTAVSGFDKYPVPQADFAKADYTLVADFAKLAQALREIAIELCQASVTVTKLVDEGNGQYVPAPGWTFRAKVTVPDGFKWVQPDRPPNPGEGPGERSQITGDNGVATFQWKPTDPNASSTVELAEDLAPGYEFVDYECTTSSGGLKKRVKTGGQTTPPATGIIGPNDYAVCTVFNRRSPQTGSITIVKDAVPNDEKVFNFSGTAPIPEFALSDNGKPSPPTERTFSGLAPGTYVISEAQQNPNSRQAPIAKWTLTGIGCNDRSVIVDGAQVTINLRANAAITCVFQNTRGDTPEPPDPVPPDPPDPPVPPSPQLPTSPGVPDIEPPPGTQLEVEKTAPATARVGQRIAFSLTVTNVGTVPAGNVLLRDLPPGAIGLNGMRSSSRGRASGGKVTWIIGTLAPGESRTITGTVRIVSGTPGKKQNTVVASADNADTVSDVADTRLRVLFQRRVIPPVTG